MYKIYSIGQLNGNICICERMCSMWMKGLLLLSLGALMLIAGCGASKGYVNDQVGEVRAEYQAEINELKAKAALNSDDIKKLQTLSSQLSEKTEMALNQAKGFENYQVIWEGTINFDYDSYEIRQVDEERLGELGKKMTDYPRALLEIVGHTDQSGSKKYNMQLGLQRSESVKRFLINNYGVALYRMFVASEGEAKPVSLPDEKNANSKNRRVVLKLWGEL